VFECPEESKDRGHTFRNTFVLWKRDQARNLINGKQKLRDGKRYARFWRHLRISLFHYAARARSTYTRERMSDRYHYDVNSAAPGLDKQSLILVADPLADFAGRIKNQDNEWLANTMYERHVAFVMMRMTTTTATTIREQMPFLSSIGVIRMITTCLPVPVRRHAIRVSHANTHGMKKI
jgi:hypothetical protein